jgi:pyruvate dehydrogenase (quinone)
MAKTVADQFSET